MARNFRDRRDFPLSRSSSPHLPSLHSSALFLTKLAKHLALVACLLIVGQPTGRPFLGPVGIFLLIVFATALHSAGRALQARLLYRPPPSRRCL